MWDRNGSTSCPTSCQLNDDDDGGDDEDDDDDDDDDDDELEIIWKRVVIA